MIEGEPKAPITCFAGNVIESVDLGRSGLDPAKVKVAQREYCRMMCERGCKAERSTASTVAASRRGRDVALGTLVQRYNSSELQEE